MIGRLAEPVFGAPVIRRDSDTLGVHDAQFDLREFGVAVDRGHLDQPNPFLRRQKAGRVVTQQNLEFADGFVQQWRRTWYAARRLEKSPSARGARSRVEIPDLVGALERLMLLKRFYAHSSVWSVPPRVWPG